MLPHNNRIRLDGSGGGHYNEIAGAIMPLLNLTQVPLAFMGPIGVPELLVVLAIAVFMFGAKKLPEVAKGLGQGIREFKNSLKGEEKAEEEKPARQSPT